MSLYYIQVSVVRRLSTFSNDISSEAEKPILFIFHIKHLHIGRGERKIVFFCGSGRIRTLVASAIYSSHRLIMGKVEIDSFCCLIGYV